MSTRTKAEKGLSPGKEAWLTEGLGILSERGIDGLTIEELCGRLNLTKGSFYHHFESRDDYSETLLGYWLDRDTERIMRETEKGSSHDEKLKRLLVLVTRNPAPYETAIRAWSLTDPLAAAYQTKVDRLRFDYLFQLFRHKYQNDDKARLKAQTVICLHIGSRQIRPPLARRELIRLIDEAIGDCRARSDPASERIGRRGDKLPEFPISAAPALRRRP